MTSRPFTCIAHRGASGYRPENTLAAFRRALEMGCSAVELDVYCVENELIVIHDDSLERTTNGTGRVQDRSLDDLRLLDAGEGEPIPLLREVIETVDHGAWINIELKGEDTADPVIALVHECLRRGWMREEFLISSFEHKELARVAELDPEIRIGALFGRDTARCVERCRALNAYSLHLGLRGADAGVVERAHQADLRVYVYTANSEEQIRAMYEIGADGVFTNYPDRVDKVMREIHDGD